MYINTITLSLDFHLYRAVVTHIPGLVTWMKMKWKWNQEWHDVSHGTHIVGWKIGFPNGAPSIPHGTHVCLIDESGDVDRYGILQEKHAETSSKTGVEKQVSIRDTLSPEWDTWCHTWDTHYQLKTKCPKRDTIYPIWDTWLSNRQISCWSPTWDT